MITPIEIQEKEFTRGLKGFKEEEVNEFLDQITLDLERLLEDNRMLQAENQQLRDELTKFHTAEHSVIDTLETAKSLMSDISASAEKRAQILMKNAELEAETIIREAQDTAQRLRDEYAVQTNKLATFRRKYREMLESELSKMEYATSEMFTELNMEDLSDIPDANEAPVRNLGQTMVRQDLSKTIIK